MQPDRRRESASTGVMSLNWMPGWGKSGTLRMARCKSAAVTLGLLINKGWAGKPVLLFCGLEFLDHFAEFGEGDILDLANAFASDSESLAHFLQCLFAPAVQAEAVTKNGRLPRRSEEHTSELQSLY